MSPSIRLYKYLPSQFVDRFVSRGDLFFRNLAYFRKIEDRGRSDLLEGLHMDRPDNPITIETTDGRIRWEGTAAILNSIDPQKVFVLCLSELFCDSLFEEFNADACIEIIDSCEFMRRCQSTIGKQIRFAETGLLHNRVNYYAPNRAISHDVTNPRLIPFFKHEDYSYQNEYRLVVALKSGLKLTTRMVNELFTFDNEVSAGIPNFRHIFIGSISDIVKVHTRSPKIE